MRLISDCLEDAKTVCIIGHVKPDGDCVGSALGLYNYLHDNYPELAVQVYLQEIPDSFHVLRFSETISHDFSEQKAYDVCFSLDAADSARLGGAIGYFNTAGRTVCVDHHITNQGFAGENHIKPEASATCELLFDLMEEDKISKETACCLYLGIVHDTGNFKHSNTTMHTMQVAGALVNKGIPFSDIVNKTFYEKTYKQKLILGQALLKSSLYLDDKCIVTYITRSDMELFGTDTRDLDGIVDSLRSTKGVECAVFLYEIKAGEYKASLRSNNYLNVSELTAGFGGGGHVRAAGCNLKGSEAEVLAILLTAIKKRL